MHLKGSVRVKESTYTLKGDELWIDTARRRGRSEGHLFVEDGVSAVSGASGEFDFEKHTGRLFQASAGYGDWRVHAKSIVLDEKRRVYYSGARFTSCDFVPPHYHFYSSRVTMVPGKHMFGYNAVYFIGKVPLFYMPVFYKSLAKTNLLRFRVQPGYDKRNGGFLKGTLITDHSNTWRSKLFLDYYSNPGLGVGGEIWHVDGDDSRGVLAGYRIRENNGPERWSITGNLYQRLPRSFAVQGTLNVLNDAYFNNDYARSSLFPMTPDLNNNAALLHYSSLVTSRLSFSRQDVATSAQAFVKNSENTRLDLQSAPVTFLGLPWLNTFSGFANNNYTRGRSYLLKTAGAAWDITRSVRIFRSLSFTPRANYSNTYTYLSQDAANTDLRNVTVGRYLGAGTLRLRTLVGDTDLTQAYARRFQPDSFTLDNGADDYSVETNMLSAMQTYRPNRLVLARMGSGYDFRDFRSWRMGFHDRLQPIQTDVVLTPGHDFSLALRNDYKVGTGNRNLIFSSTLGNELRTFITGGLGYNLSEPDRYYLNTEFGWTNSSGTLRLVGAVRSSVRTPGGVGGLHALYVFDREGQIIRRWHDFYTKLAFRLRPRNVQEISIRIEMKFGGYDAQRQKVHDWESEWYPERRQGREDRP